MVAACCFSDHASELLDLHRESLMRFEVVTLTQRLVDGRKMLSLSIDVFVDAAKRKKKKPRNPRRKEKDRKRQKARREKKRLEKAASHPALPTVQTAPPLPSLPDSPIGWFGNIPQLDGDTSSPVAAAATTG